MKPNLPILLPLAFWSGLAATSPGAIIVQDTFATGTGDWYRAGTAGTLTTASGELSWTQGADQNRQVIGRSFTPTTLAVGETMRLSFTYRQAVSGVSILRIGLYDLQNPITADGWSSDTTNIGGTFAGYTTFVRDNSADGNNARHESGTISVSTTGGPLYSGNNIGTLDTTVYDINGTGTVTYNVTFDVTRTSAGTTSTQFTMTSGGGTHFSIGASTSNPSYLTNTFDMVGLRSGGGTTLIDNVTIEVIPEPSGVILSAVGLAGLAFRRTRKS